MSELSDLGERVLREAGFEVFVHAMGRPDLNDYDKREDCYIRALHNLERAKPFYESLLFDSIGSGVNFNHVFPQIPAEYQINPKVRNAQTSHTANKKGNPRQIYYWLLFDNVWEERYDTGEKTKGTIEVPRDGFWGKLGFTKIQEIKLPVMKHRNVYTPANIGGVLGTSADEPAYVVKFPIDKEIRDSAGRSTNDPDISVFAGKTLADDLITYALRNPQDYYDLVRSFMPEARFPNVRQGILSPPMKTNPSMDGKNYNGVEACDLYTI
jgi:hypothetical protein